jgi:2-oxoisovalerate/pyruvate ferredoxin oxidoreductase gamma subunit
MIEIRVHGRGGQGSVVVADLLALAFAKENKYVQSFPSFGPERRSAPVTAFVRADDSPIRLRCAIYNPGYLLILDASLFSVPDFVSGLRESGYIIVNSRHEATSFGLMPRYQVATVDANAIAIAHHLGSKTNPIANTAMLGAFAKYTHLISIDSISDSIRESISINTEANIAAARESYDKTS